MFTSTYRSNKNFKKSKSKEEVKKEVTTLDEPGLTKPFDALKIALTTAPVLETDASLKGLGAVLSQQDNTSTVCVTAYPSQTSRSS